MHESNAMDPILLSEEWSSVPAVFYRCVNGTWYVAQTDMGHEYLDKWYVEHGIACANQGEAIQKGREIAKQAGISVQMILADL